MASLLHPDRKLITQGSAMAGFSRSRLIQFVPILAGLFITACVVIFLGTHPQIHPDILFDDVVSFVDFQTYTIPPYLSLFSFVGFALWFLGAGFCILAALVLKINARSSQRVLRYLAALAALGLVLGFDDMLRLHENLIPYYTGISENLILGAYALYFVVLLLVFHRENRAHHYWYFMMFYALFGFSEVVDVLSPTAMQLQGDPVLGLVEESAKFLALVVFATYCLYFSLQEVRSSFLNSAQQADKLNWAGIDDGVKKADKAVDAVSG